MKIDVLDRNFEDEKLHKLLFVTGIVAIMASLLMFSGDMLLYYTSEPINDLEKAIPLIMSKISNWRLVFGGLLGPISAILYLFGFLQIYYMIKPEYSKFAKIILITFVIMIVIGGTYHALFAPLGFIAASKNVTLLTTMMSFLDLMGGLTSMLAGLGHLMLVLMIITKRTLLPRWSIIFSPFITIWLGFGVVNLPQPLLVIIGGGWGNLVMFIFFSVNTLLLYKKLGK